MDRLRPPLGPRVPDALEPLDPAALEDETRYRLERVILEDCDLRETSLAEAVLRDVRFERCDLGGVELSRVRLQRVELRGCRLEGVAVEHLRGATMPWEDIVGNAGLFAGALGIRAAES